MAKPGAPPSPPGLPGRPGGLGQKIEYTVERVSRWVVAHLMETVAGWIGWAFELFMHALRPGMLRVFGPFLRFFRDLDGTPPEFKGLINNALEEEGEAGAGALLALGSSVGGAAIGSVTSSLFAPITHYVNRRVRPARADPGVANAMAWRNSALINLMRNHLRDQGWDDPLIDAWYSVLKPRLAVAELLVYERRYSGSPESTDAELVRRGYNPGEAGKMRRLMDLIPGPADLVAMGVREAWDDNIAARFGYDENFPNELGDWMRRSGDVDNWAQKYWRAHWQLPSLNVMLNALHRLPEVDMDTLDLYLRVADVAPTFRDYIKKTAYMPYTRVDTRRMYRFGILDAAGVHQAYLDQGYDSEHAANLTAFTIADATEEDREATKTDILSGYNAGVISRTDAQAWLQSIGYSPDLAGYFLAREDAKRAQSLKKRQVATVQKLYTGSSISASAARTSLTGLGVAGAEIEILLDEWHIAREAKVRRPPIGKLDSFLLEDIIPEGEYRQELAALGFQEKYIGWYTSGLLAQKTSRARVEEERARTEQERIRERRAKTDYQVAKAQLDVDIAELRTAIAETQEAMGERLARYERDLALARRVVSEADLRSTAARALAGQDVLVSDANVAAAHLRNSVATNEVRIAALRQELAAGQVEIVPDLEALQVEIAVLEDQANLVREARDADQTAIREIELVVASERRAATDALVEIAGEYEALRSQVVGLESEANRVREDRDTDQTEIREIELAVERGKLQADEAIDQAATEEDAAIIEGAFEVYVAEADVAIAALRVRIEEREDRLAEIRTEVFGLQEDVRLEAVQVEALTSPIEDALASSEAALQVSLGGLRVSVEAREDSLAGLRSEIGRLQGQVRVLGVPGEGIALQIREYDSQARVDREGIAALQVSIAESRQNAMIIQSSLVSDLAALAVTRNVVEVEAEYRTDRADQEARLATLRSNVAMLREAKARLVVGYREALVA